MSAIICDECNLDMKWFDYFPDACGCCGTDYYKCPQCGAEKQKIMVKV